MYAIDAKSEDFADCHTEQPFKMKYINLRMKKARSNSKVFCIETEETCAGFPDVIELVTISAGSCTQIFFYEFKCSDHNGNIKFQPTQPAFYRRNSELNIKVIAYNQYSKRVHLFSTNEIFNKDSPYYTTNGRIGLTGAEKELGV